MLVRVVAPHFVAGLIMRDDIVTEAAPILRWAIGKSRADIREYFKRKGWEASLVRMSADLIER